MTPLADRTIIALAGAIVDWRRRRPPIATPPQRLQIGANAHDTKRRHALNTGDPSMTAALRPYDEALLRRAFDVARRSREAGDHPFGSLIADGDGKELMEQGNGYSSEGGDRTAHAERLIATRASRAYDLEVLSRCTLYTSAEPC